MLSSARSVVNNQIQTYNSPTNPIRNLGVVINPILSTDDTLLQQSNLSIPFCFHKADSRFILNSSAWIIHSLVARS